MKYEPDTSTSQRRTARPPWRLAVATASLTACAHCGTTPEPPPPDPVPPREQQLCRSMADVGGNGSVESSTVYEYNALGQLVRTVTHAAGRNYGFAYGISGGGGVVEVTTDYGYDEAGCNVSEVRTYSTRMDILDYACDELGRRAQMVLSSDQPNHRDTVQTWSYVGVTDQVSLDRREYNGFVFEQRSEWEGDCEVRREMDRNPPEPSGTEIQECTCGSGWRECRGTLTNSDTVFFTREEFDSHGEPTLWAVFDAQREPGRSYTWEYNAQGNVTREVQAGPDGGVEGVITREYAYLDEGGCPRESTDLEGSGSEP